MAVKSYEEYLEEVRKNNQATLNETNNTINSTHDTQKEQVNKNYTEQTKVVEDDYRELYDQNAVQKLINERKVAENMANLGLTDSGLNRTQQTAVQLSYANNKAKFDLSKQKSLDSLASELASKISEIEISRTESLQNAKNSWDSQNQSYAVDMYNTDVEAETERYKAEQEQIAATNKALIEAASNSNYIISVNNGKLRKDFTGSLADKGVRVEYTYDDLGDKVKTTYTDTNSGKKTTMDSKINPYTNTINPDVYNGVWKNGTGYQPDNIGGTKLQDTGEKGTLYGIEQKIFKLKATTGNRNNANREHYYIWNGRENEYVRVVEEDGEWVIR